MPKRKTKKQAEAPSDHFPSKPVETPEDRNWRDCLRALDATMFDGKGGAIHCDWSKHYIKETAEALFAWMVRYCAGEGYDRRRGANAANALDAALSRIDTMVYWLRLNRRDGFAAEVEERAKALLTKCPFDGYASDDALRMAQDDRAFDQARPDLWLMAYDFQGQLKRLLVSLGKEAEVERARQEARTAEGGKPSRPKLTQTEQRALVVATIYSNPNASDRELAELMNIPPSTFRAWPEYKAARKESVGDAPEHGYKKTSQGIEATRKRLPARGRRARPRHD